MGDIAVRNATRGTEVARAVVADRFWSRMRGLLGRRLAEGQGMLIVPCKSVHTFGMKYDIDVAFIDDAWRVIAALPGLRPWRISSFHASAYAVLELPTASLERSATQVGDQLSFVALS